MQIVRLSPARAGVNGEYWGGMDARQTGIDPRRNGRDGRDGRRRGADDRQSAIEAHRGGADAPPAADDAHRAAVYAYIRYLWGDGIASRGVLYDPKAHPGFAAVDEDVLLGGLLYRIDGVECEAIALFSLIQGQGVGTALLNAARDTARAAGCQRFWLGTTNDNTHAIRFYQRYGFRLKAVHIDAIDESRKLKPISALGEDGIPIQHEFEFEIALV